MAVIGGDDDQRVPQDPEILQFGHRRFHRVVELQQIPQSTVVVERVHLFVNGRALGHQEESFAAAALVQDVDRFQRHLFQAGQIGGVGLVPGRGVGLVLEILGVHVPIQPDRQVRDGKDPECFLVGGRVGQGGFVQGDAIPRFGKLLVVIFALVRRRIRQELLRSAPEHDIGAVEVGPGVIGHAPQLLVNQRTVRGPRSRVPGQGHGGGVSHVGGRHHANRRPPHAVQNLHHGFDFGVVERVRRGVGVHAHGVDGGFVTGV